MAEHTALQEVIEDIREFFLNSQHWVYRSPGTLSQVSPDSVYHVTQIEVLFEDRHFHDRTYRALQQLLKDGFLRSRAVTVWDTSTILLWRSNVRYVERAIKSHLELMSRYSSQQMNKATGDYAELLTLMGLSRLHLDLVSRNSNSYRGKVWTASGHDLDFVMERDGLAYGIEVKNTYNYFPDHELEIKLKMCEYLELVPLFVVRHRHAKQWTLTRQHRGLLDVFKSKILPPGQSVLAQEIWQQMRLPVTVWSDWPGQFYPAIAKFLQERTK